MTHVDTAHRDTNEDFKNQSDQDLEKSLRQSLCKVFPEVLASIRERVGFEVHLDSTDKTYCALVNGLSILALMKHFKIPGMVFRGEVDPSIAPFKDKSWHYHAVGVVLLVGDPGQSEATYGVIDATSFLPETAIIHSGSLTDLTKFLNETYGGDWRLDFVPPNQPENSIAAKLENAQKLIATQSPSPTYEGSIMYDGLGSAAERPLGLKVHLLTNGMSDSIRDLMTHGHV